MANPYSFNKGKHLGGGKLLPACKVSSSISLQQDGRPADLSVPDPLQPPSHRLLDLDAGRAKFVRPELLQIRYLSSPEEDLCFSKLEHVWVLEEIMQRAGYDSPLFNNIFSTENHL